MEEMQNSYAGLISIHAAREGGDAVSAMLSKSITISIHAAREGGDCYNLDNHKAGGHFNPRRP